MTKHFISKAPARICLFGDHQDYLELPIIACAINRHITIEAKPNQNHTLHIVKQDLNTTDTIQIDAPLKVSGADFLHLSLKVLARYNCMPNQGYDVHISSNIPINAGLSSSSALTVAWIQFLVHAFGIDAKITPQLMAKLAYEVEVQELNASGGKMDQYTIGLGDMIFMNTKTDAVELFSAELDVMIIGDSGEGKDTLGTLGHLKHHALVAIQQVKAKYPEFDIISMKKSELNNKMALVDTKLQPVFEAAVKNYQITQKAKTALQQNDLDYVHIGDLMNEHHQLLKDNLQITTPKIDAMITAARHAGAYGAKIVGSGKGGCIVALASKEKSHQVIEAIKNAGAKDAFSVKQSQGAQITITS